MAILIDQSTRVLCQGISGWAGSYHTHRMIQYGTKIVGGVVPGKGGKSYLDVPVFDRVKEAVSATRANATVVIVPPQNACAAIIEAIEAAVPLVVAVTDRMPILDMIRVREALHGSETRLVGPNSQGVLTPEMCQMGVMSTDRASAGKIGVMSRSASLTSEVVSQLSTLRLGQSTIVGIGGDPVHGIGFVDCLKMFLADKATDAIVMIGETGGFEEQAAAEYLRTAGNRKPVAALIVGHHLPIRRRMGHAGILTSRGSGDAASKTAALRSAGVTIARGANMVGATVLEMVRKHPARA